MGKQFWELTERAGDILETRFLTDARNLEATGADKQFRRASRSVNPPVEYGTGFRGVHVLGEAISVEWWWCKEGEGEMALP